MGGSMLPGLVGDGELAQVVSSNLGLDFYPGEGLAVVATHHLSGMTSVPMASLWVKPLDGPAQELIPRPWGAVQLCHCAPAPSSASRMAAPLSGAPIARGAPLAASLGLGTVDGRPCPQEAGRPDQAAAD